MKRLSLLCLLLCSFMLSCEQRDFTNTQSTNTAIAFDSTIIKDSATLNYIYSLNKFVSLTDEAQLPRVTKSEYMVIINYFLAQGMNKQNYFIDTSGIRESEYALEIPMYHYNGFIEQLKLIEYNQKTELQHKSGNFDKPFKVITGNYSGYDGYLEINRTNGMVYFYKWQ